MWVYPPGVPVLLPGERVTEGAASYLAEAEAMGASVAAARGAAKGNIRVLAWKQSYNVYNKSLRSIAIMKRILSLNTRDLATSKKEGGCGECQTSCQSACKTSCGVANQKCEKSAK